MLWVYTRIIGTRDNGKANGNYCIGVILGLYRDNTPIMENQMEKKWKIKWKLVLLWIPFCKIGCGGDLESDGSLLLSCPCCQGGL